MALLLHQNVTRRAASVSGESPPLLPRRKRLGFPPGVAAALETDGEGGAVSGTGAAVPGFLRNPAMARRELLRQFYGASTWQQQMELLQSAEAQPLGLETSLEMMCHIAQLAQKGMLPGARKQQSELLAALSVPVVAALPSLQPVHVATTLWSHAVVGAGGPHIDQLLQQVALRELKLGDFQRYNTRELTSMLYAYGLLLRQPSSDASAYVSDLAAELARRWREAPYVKSSFSSKDFADLAEALAALFGSSSSLVAPALSGVLSGKSADDNLRKPSSQLGASPPEQLVARQLEPSVAALLDELAGEVRRQLSNKHGRSPWTPRDLVRLARSFAALAHSSPRTAPMLDALSSFAVHRIRSRHLNCVSRPADLTGLLAAFADLNHRSVAVPDLLAAVGDQVRRGAARRQEQLAAARPRAAAAATAAAAAPAQPLLAQQEEGGHAEAADEFSLAQVASLVDSHLRLGYRPPALLLQCLAPQILRQMPSSSAEDAAALLQQLAAVPCNPGLSVVHALLGRVEDGRGAQHELAEAARQAADAAVRGGSV